MGLFIGNIQNAQNFTLDNKTLEADRADHHDPNTAPIYGVVFDPKGEKHTGRRLYEAKQLEFKPSIGVGTTTSTISSGIDTFRTKADPFKIEKVYIGPFNSSTNTHQINNENVGSADNYKSYYIRFPKFYYCRPQKWEFLVSPKYLPGFFPSPMHYRDGKMYKYAYVSKYDLFPNMKWSDNKTHQYIPAYNANTSTTKFTVSDLLDSAGNYLKYKPSTLFANADINETGCFRALYNLRYNGTTELRQETAWPLDYASVCMIYFLMYIKYATMAITSWDTSHVKLYEYDGDNTQSATKVQALAHQYMAKNNKIRLQNNISVNTNNNGACFDGLVYLTTNKYSAVYETMGLSGFVGQKMYMSGVYTNENGIQIYDLDRYYKSNSIFETTKKFVNENEQSDSWNNYQIKTQSSNESIPLTSQNSVYNIGYSKNVPWALFPVDGNSETNSRSFYFGSSSGAIYNQLSQIMIDLGYYYGSGTTAPANFLILNTMMPFITTPWAQHRNAEITSAGIRGYFVQDT